MNVKLKKTSIVIPMTDIEREWAQARAEELRAELATGIESLTNKLAGES